MICFQSENSISAPSASPPSLSPSQPKHYKEREQAINTDPDKGIYLVKLNFVVIKFWI